MDKEGYNLLLCRYSRQLKLNSEFYKKKKLEEISIYSIKPIRSTESKKIVLVLVEALPEGAPMSLVWILKRLVSVFINAARRCRKFNENSLSLSEF